MLGWLIEMLIGTLRLPRRWDGMRISAQGTLTTAVRRTAGSEPGISSRWQSCATTITAGHLQLGPGSLNIASAWPEQARPPQPNELWSLGRDFTVVPLVSQSGARVEWALRASELESALDLLGI